MSILTRAFWTAAFERAIKTAAQAALLVLGADQVNVIAVDWQAVAGFAAGGLVLSLLTSLASANFGSAPGPSLANEYTLPTDLGGPGV